MAQKYKKPLSKTLEKIKDPDLMSYQEWAEMKERTEGPEKGLEDADFVPLEGMSPAGMGRKAIKKGIRAMGKRPIKPGPILDYKNLGKSPNEKLPRWKLKMQERRESK